MLKNIIAPDNSAPLVRASLRITHLMAVHKKPFTEAEDVIGPALLIVAEELFDKNALNKAKSIPFSNDTMTKRTQLIAEEVLSFI